MTNFQKTALTILVIAVAAWWGGCEYGISRVKVVDGKDSTIAITLRDTIGVPVPGASLPPIIKWKHDTLENDVPHTIYIDTGSYPFDIVNDYYSKIPHLDTSNPEVTIWDTTEKNRILPGRRVSVKSTVKTVTETKTVYPPKTTVLSFDFLVSTDVLKRYGLGAGFTLKTPKDYTYGLSASAITNTGLLYQFKFGQPIHLNIFKKRKP